MDPGGFSASSCSVGASRTQTGLIILKTMRDHTGPDPAQSPGRCLLTLLSPTLLFYLWKDYHPFSFLKGLSRTCSVGISHKCGLLRPRTACMGHLRTPGPGRPSNTFRLMQRPSKVQLWKKSLDLSMGASSVIRATSHLKTRRHRTSAITNETVRWEVWLRSLAATFTGIKQLNDFKYISCFQTVFAGTVKTLIWCVCANSGGYFFSLSTPELNALPWIGLAWGEELIDSTEKKNLEGWQRRGP